MMFGHRNTGFSSITFRFIIGLCLGLLPGSYILAAEADLAAAGEAHYNQLCAACHNGSLLEAPRIEALRLFSPQRIVDSLESGVMAVQGMPLSREEKRQVAFFLTGQEHTDSAIETASFSCSSDLTAPLSFSAPPLWNGWGSNPENTRHQTQDTGISSSNVASLELKWAFSVPGATRSRAQPVVTDEVVFVGSQQGVIYALDSENGCPVWTFTADAEMRGALFLDVDERGYPDTIYFGDFKANAYALDASTGELQWKTKVHEHPRATVTGSVIAHDGVLVVPVSSTEIILASRNEYSCCSFRGAIAGVATDTGELMWRTYTTDEPRPTIRNTQGVQQYGPSGAPVWSGPTIDVSRNLVYATTGQNYSSPATGTSDAVLALDLQSGEVQWVSQMTANDAWNGACSTGGVNCPEEDGPDYDIGASAIIGDLENGKQVILVGQKSGMVHALDPDKAGEIIWQERVGSGGTMGGVHYGMSTDDQHVYVGVSDLPTNNPYNVGDPNPGLRALNIETGEQLWSIQTPNVCDETPFLCWPGISAAISSSNGLIFAGGLDGMLRAFDASNGDILWEANTRQEFGDWNGVAARGGSIESDGPVIAGDRIYITSGYEKWAETPGNVLLVYGLPD